MQILSHRIKSSTSFHQTQKKKSQQRSRQKLDKTTFPLPTSTPPCLSIITFTLILSQRHQETAALKEPT